MQMGNPIIFPFLSKYSNIGLIIMDLTSPMLVLIWDSVKDRNYSENKGAE